jgi:hypothetical protein
MKRPQLDHEFRSVLENTIQLKEGVLCLLG